MFLDLLRTTDMLSRGPAQVLKTQALSSTQYNVLRILRGSPEGLPCGEVANRMITRDPDVTRLLDRLEKRGLVQREDVAADRRAYRVTLTPEGARLLEAVLPRYHEEVRRVCGHLSPRRAAELIADCRQIAQNAERVATVELAREAPKHLVMRR